MKLLYTPIKDYVHTVEAVINYCELADRIELVPTKPFEAGAELGQINPLGKVPTLILDSGEFLAGGPVIYEYLDSLHRRRKLHPAKGSQRWTTLRQAWMADGLFDTFVLLIIESWLPQSQQRPAYLQRCFGKIVAILEQIERDVPGYQRLDIGQMRTVGALQFLQMKMPQVLAECVGLDTRFELFEGRPQTRDWFRTMSRRKLFRKPLSKQE